MWHCLIQGQATVTQYWCVTGRRTYKHMTTAYTVQNSMAIVTSISANADGTCTTVPHAKATITQYTELRLHDQLIMWLVRFGSAIPGVPNPNPNPNPEWRPPGMAGRSRLSSGHCRLDDDLHACRFCAQ